MTARSKSSSVFRHRPQEARAETESSKPRNIVQGSVIQWRARAAGIRTRIGNQIFRATGITAYLKNGGTLEKAAMIANHASTRTTQLYDRRNDEVSLDEVERIPI